MRDAIVAAARAYLGVRYRHQGRTRAGLDCIGLVIRVAHDLGLTEFDTRSYPRQAVGEQLLEGCRAHLVAVPAACLAPGDLLVTQWDTQRHIGVVGDHPLGLSLIHAYAPVRKVIEARLDDQMLARVIGRFRFPGVV